MKASILLPAVCLAITLIALLADDRASTKSENPIHAWTAPAGKPYWRDDGEGPYAASWPTIAVVTKYAQSAPGADKRAALWDSTLFLLASPELHERNALKSIPSAARFATACRSECRGAWVRFAPPPEEPFFVLAHASGGTAGDIVRVFRHFIQYDSPHFGESVFQDHGFSIALEAFSRITPLIGEIDRDGHVALLLGSVETNSSGAPGTPQRYRVFMWDAKHNSFQIAREIEADDAKRHRQLSEF